MKKSLLLLAVWSVLSLTVSAPTQALTLYCEDDAPFQMRGPNATLTGMTVEFVTEIQKRVGNADPIQMVPWARGLDALDNQPDTLLFSVARTAERNDLYQWIGPIAETSYAFYTRADSKLMIEDLEAARKVGAIGVYREDVRDKFLTKEGFTNLERTSDNVANFKKLMSGRIDMYASSFNSIKDDAERAQYKVTDVKLAFVFLRRQLFIAASRKTDPDTVAKWNAALEGMKKDDTFRRIFKKYYPDSNLPGPAITKF